MLREFFPEAVEQKTEVTYDSSLRRVIGRTVTLFHDLVLAEQKSEQVPLAEAAAILAREVMAGNCPLKKWITRSNNGSRDSTLPRQHFRTGAAAAPRKRSRAVD
jgi:hypothetical protein